ncbi:MAG: nitroreductase family deazaflavin-dependent oxidoreductase [Candidatus Heimdallarchaeaceae archaeon]
MEKSNEVKEEKKKIMFYPRPGSAEYNFLMADKEARERSLKRWKAMNKYLVIPLYRIGILPLFGFSFIFLLLFTKGRKTGKRRITPLEYHRIDGVIHIFASRGERTHWLKNIRANPEEVKIRIGYRKFEVKPEIVEDIEERKKILEWYIRKYPQAAKMLMGWDPRTDKLENTDLTFLAENIVPVRLYKKK